MLVSNIFLTRKCSLNCSYCNIKKQLDGPELEPEQWIEVFGILEKLGSSFNLILGNEPLLLGDGLVKIIESLKTPYGMYSTAPEPWFSELKEPLVKAGLKNFSCGIDTLNGDDDVAIKARRGLSAILEMKRLGVPDSQGQITISKRNLYEVEAIVTYLSYLGIYPAVNAIHWNKLNCFDFFPKKENMEEYLITDPVDKEYLSLLMETLVNRKEKGQILLQNPLAHLLNYFRYAINLDWHCKKPYILSIDSDGHMMLCGYRRGKEVSKYTIFDLMDTRKFNRFIDIWCKESKQCPGCFWGYSWFVDYWNQSKQEDYGEKVLATHHSKYYKESNNA